ncbi:MAG: MarR family winged helix-turn-helix transcriptional regulator [Phycisphaerales bacterium JB061]
MGSPDVQPQTSCSKGREACLGRHVYVLFHLLMRQCDAAAEEIGLTSSRWFLLCSIGESEHEPTVGELSDECMLSTQAVSQLVAAMEKEGLVTRHTKPGSGRSVYVRITDEGRQALSQTDAIATRIEGRLLAGLDQSEIDRISDDLERLIENMSSKEAETPR